MRNKSLRTITVTIQGYTGRKTNVKYQFIDDAPFLTFLSLVRRRTRSNEPCDKCIIDAHWDTYGTTIYRDAKSAINNLEHFPT